MQDLCVVDLAIPSLKMMSIDIRLFLDLSRLVRPLISHCAARSHNPSDHTHPERKLRSINSISHLQPLSRAQSHRWYHHVPRLSPNHIPLGPLLHLLQVSSPPAFRVSPHLRLSNPTRPQTSRSSATDTLVIRMTVEIQMTKKTHHVSTCLSRMTGGEGMSSIQDQTCSRREASGVSSRVRSVISVADKNLHVFSFRCHLLDQIRGTVVCTEKRKSSWLSSIFTSICNCIVWLLSCLHPYLLPSTRLMHGVLLRKLISSISLLQPESSSPLRRGDLSFQPD